MSSKFVFYSKVTVKEEKFNEAWLTWREVGSSALLENMERRCFYQEDQSNRFLELIAIDSFSDVEFLLNERKLLVDSMKNFVVSDLHQQIFSLVEAVKPSESRLPTSEKLQLRYIEVPLSVKEEYLNWREETIFDVVRNAPEVKYFQAYNTLLSTQPGVMFFSEYEGDTETYMNTVFRTERYNKIVKDAGDKYISGGEDGLYLISYIGE